MYLVLIYISHREMFRLASEFAFHICNEILHYMWLGYFSSVIYCIHISIGLNRWQLIWDPANDRE